MPKYKTENNHRQAPEKLFIPLVFGFSGKLKVFLAISRFGVHNSVVLE
jgi:hypothetical protein